MRIQSFGSVINELPQLVADDGLTVGIGDFMRNQIADSNPVVSTGGPMSVDALAIADDNAVQACCPP
jgi:hypothetical protein